MRLLLVAVLALTALSSSVFSQAPESLGFQGFLTDSLGSPVQKEKGLDITFTLYKAGAPVWLETQSVLVIDGSFNVLLGNVTPMDSVAFNQPMELGIKVNSDPSEMTPRTTLSTVAFARGLPGLYTFHRLDGLDRSYNVVGGGPNNVVGPGVVGATVLGGGVSGGTDFPNSVEGDYGTVSGGLNNSALGRRDVVGGGFLNVASGGWSTIGGGGQNAASGRNASVLGGRHNTASGDSSTVGGGAHNAALGLVATVGGGSANTADTSYTVVGGGETNTASGLFATVGGGQTNTASGHSAAIIGGGGNTASQNHATVGGGNSNEASGSLSTVGGGFGNYAGSIGATVPGGAYNFVSGDYAFAAGLRARALHNGSFVWQDYSAFGGSSLESTGPNQFVARSSGGFRLLTSEAPDIHQGLFVNDTLVARAPEGFRLLTSLSPDPDEGVLVNGSILTIKSDGVPEIKFVDPYATWRFRTQQTQSDTLFLISGDEHALAIDHKNGHAGLGTTATYYPLTVGDAGSFDPDDGNGAFLSGAGVWTNASSREFKTDFEPLDSGLLLKTLSSLEITRWRYKGEEDITHIGPVAEEFRSAFGLGGDEQYIGTVDADGVALAAIQGLYELVQELQAEVKALKAERR